ncbi:hypothetical protein KC345_g3366 [Hortaea werneckii]|nr:hypothetical protein KC345_g3366 [Hortaea werneckii]
MFLWTTPRAQKSFGTTRQFAQESKSLAANQGLYNGFLAAGLFWSLFHPNDTFAFQLQLFFLICVIAAAAYGGMTAKKSILLVQGLPALLAIAAVILANLRLWQMDYEYLIREINRSYPLQIERIKLHREMIGGVFKTDDALQSIRILDYLQANAYPAVSVLRTVHQESHLLLEHQGSLCPAILYDYAEGGIPDGNIEAESIGQQTGELHQIMRSYPDPLIHRTKADYIDDYLCIMRELDCDPGQILDLERYGHELWNRNMIRDRNGKYVLFDFDDASGDYPVMDVAYMSDDTHFNQLQESMVEQTLRKFERFYSGYRKVRTLGDNEFYAIFDFIAVRHYQIISRIVRCQGLQSVSREFCAEQHRWLMDWRELCVNRHVSG